MKQLIKSLSYILTISLLVLLIPSNSVSASTPTHIYEWMSQSGTISADLLAHEYTNLEAGQTINLSLTLINRSTNTIQSRNRLGQSPGKQVPVGSYGIGSQTPYQDGTPYFLDTSSFVLNNNRFAYYEGNDVLPNEAISMSWTIKLANNLADGVYKLYVRPVSEYLAWTRQIKTGKLLPTTSSDIFWRLTVGEVDNRILLQPGYGDDGTYLGYDFYYNGNCSEYFNKDLPNATETYCVRPLDICVDIPYNKNWGTSKYRIEPYTEFAGLDLRPDETGYGLNFGWIAPFEGCSLNRKLRLAVKNYKPVQEVYNEAIQDDSKTDVEKLVVNGLDVVKYISHGMFSTETVVVVGSMYNYELQPLGSIDYPSQLMDVVETITLGQYI